MRKKADNDNERRRGERRRRKKILIIGRTNRTRSVRKGDSNFLNG